MALRAQLLLAAGMGTVVAQQAGSVVKEEPPPMSIQSCTKEQGCVTETAAVTIDANWRWVHQIDGYENCFSGSGWSSQYCPDAKTCATTCALEGVDAQGYEKTYGVKAVTGGVELAFVSPGGNVGSRVYVTDGADSYKLFKLKNREFTFDVDVASLACGMNGAMYFVEMDAAGGLGKGDNNAGAKYGTGYCDAQCPHDVKWMEGEANIDGSHGMCCFEMDIWEANRMATAFTPHPCTVAGAYKCTGTECGDNSAGERFMGVCDKDGCDFNAHRMGALSQYGVGSGFAVDTSKPVTVVTQFLTANGTDEGDLSEIRRFYIQDDKVIPEATPSISGVSDNSLTDAQCSVQKEVFGEVDDHKEKGGLAAMGEALERGMVLALSLWDDPATEMRWLDSRFPFDDMSGRAGVERGPCSDSPSNPSYLRSAHATSSVKYTNIRYGEIGSTTPAPGRRLDIMV